MHFFYPRNIFFSQLFTNYIFVFSQLFTRFIFVFSQFLNLAISHLFPASFLTLFMFVFSQLFTRFIFVFCQFFTRLISVFSQIFTCFIYFYLKRKVSFQISLRVPRTAQADLKRHFTQMSESHFSRVASHFMKL